jgi:putative tryptophan/tyrosine transport system substrate-binding protein
MCLSVLIGEIGQTMRRREFISLIGSAAVARPFAAQAQQPAQELPRIGAIYALQSENSEAFVQGLLEAGYVDGRNMVLEARSYAGPGTVRDRYDQYARELVALKCGVIFASNPYAIQAVLKATNTIPTVGIDLESDPVASGLAKSLARPGGNFTGFFLDIPELGGKQIELLREAVPAVSRLAVLWDATIGAVQFHATETAARSAGVVLQSLPIRRQEDVNETFQHAVREQAQAMVILSSPLIFRERAHIADLGLKTRLPTISLFNSFPRFGGLMAYGPDFPSIFKQAADYVGRILGGSKPAELPIQRPTKFELVVNTKTAQAIGLTLPEPLLVRADEVIE